MKYELMILTKVGTEAAGKVEKIVKDAAGNSLAVNRLGKKPLSYPLAKQMEAEYTVFNFEAPPDSVKLIVDKLRLEQESILRYLITRAEGIKVSKRAKGAKVSEALQKEEGETPRVTVKTVTAKSRTSAGKSTKATIGTKSKKQKAKKRKKK